MLTTTPPRFILLAALCILGSAFVKGAQLVSDVGSTTKPATTDKPKHIFDFNITSDMKTSDFDDPESALRKQIAFIVKGESKASEYLSIAKEGRTPEMQIQIKDDSIFKPGNDDKNAQKGFRRTDVNLNIDPAKVFKGTTTFYQSIRFDPDAPLVLNHGYLLASIEDPSNGAHAFDIFVGSDFESSNTDGKETPNAHQLRVRDLDTKTLFQFPLKNDTTYNFAIMVDWDKSTLTVYASTGKSPLKMVAGPVKNNMGKFDTTKAECHIQLIKFPLPDKKIDEKARSDVPHVGIQEPIKKEHVSFSNIFITSGADIVQPKFGGSRHSRCKI